MKPAIIYALHDPDGSVRYIGWTVLKPASRLARHMRMARLGDQSYRSRWIRTLDAPPTITVVENTMADIAYDREKFWIAEFRRCGSQLTNTTDGGRGTLGRVQSIAERERRAAKLRGRIVPPEVGAAISATKLASGYRHSAETRAKQSLAKKGKPWSAKRRAAFEAKRMAS